MSAAPDHLSPAALLDYWLGDADPAATDAADEHLMACEACGEALDGLIALGEGVRAALRAGTVATVAGHAFVQRLAAQGVQVREYRVAPGGSVNCSVAPGDGLLVSCLQAPLQGVQRLDLQMELSIEPGTRHEMHDLPFDPQVGEVMLVSKLSDVRRQPAHDVRTTLFAVDESGRREIGRYAFHHRPWPDA